MNKLSKLFLLCVIVGSLASCGSDATNNQAAVVNSNDITTQTRGVNKFTTLDMTTVETIQLMKMENQQDNEDDAAIVGNIYSSAMTAEKEAKALDVSFSAAEEVVENGLFVFSVNSSIEKELELEMFDEEGFTMAANNKIALTQGENYRALNVESLDDGTYTFRLKDAEGKELTRKITIKANETE